MTLASEMAADIVEMIADFTATFTYNGTSYNCTCSPVARSSQVDPEGIFQNHELEICSATYTGTKPPVKSVIIVTDSALELSAVNYWVMDSTLDFGGLTMRLRRGRQ